jgi:AcrR family transcriptional regulator
MIQSATAERKAATTARLTSVSRRWTAERGLNGFTLEQLCDEVGISRRSFFNHFPSKEECVLGVDEGDAMQRAAEQFLARGSRGWSVVVDDLVEIGAEFAAAMDVDVDEHTDFIRAIDREPRLLARALGMNREREQQLAELVAAREAVGTADPRVRAAVSAFGTLARTSVERLMQPDSGLDFHTALLSSLAALREVLTTPTSRKDHA